jgi:ATP-dependent Lon protease
VEAPEQPEEISADLQAEAEPSASVPVDGGRGGHGTTELLAAGESSTLEFKSSARWNSYTRQRDPAIELAVVKTVAGFMNTRGGTLLIGVGDHGQVVGLDHDLKTLGRRDYDGYENWLTTLLETSIGKPALSHLAVRFERLEGGMVCRVEVRPSKKPVFVSSGKTAADFYVRLNNSTRLLNTAEALDYVHAHWA